MLDCLGVSSIITRVLVKGRQEGESQRGREEVGRQRSEDVTELGLKDMGGARGQALQAACGSRRAGKRIPAL